MEVEDASLGMMTKTEKAEALCSSVETESSFLLQGNLDRELIVQIRGQYIVQIAPNRQLIESGFSLSCEKQFEILLYPEPNTNKPAIGYIHFQSPPNVSLVLFSKNVVELKHFVRILEKKNIAQKGILSHFEPICKLKLNTFNFFRLRDRNSLAVKNLSTSKFFSTVQDQKALAKKVQILSKIKSRYFSRFQGVYRTHNSVYIASEMLSLSFSEYCNKYDHPDEEKVSYIMYQLFKGVQYLHKMGIMHRNLKLDNLMLRYDSPDITKMEMVIIGFHLADYTKGSAFKKCGTSGYTAPEILNMKEGSEQHYTEACDLFSLGCIFHYLLTKKFLFCESPTTEGTSTNLKREINFLNPIYKNLSEVTKSLLFGLLEVDPKRRINIQEALNHQFFSKKGKKIKQKESIETTSSEQ